METQLKTTRYRAFWPTLLFTLSASLLSFPSLGQDYPTRAIELVVPFAPGGGTDIVARRLSINVSKALGQSIIVVNRPGAATQIGTAAVAKSSPDGYTLLLSALPHVTNPSLFKTLPYDTVKDFAPISLIARIPSVLVVSPRIKARSIKELVALSKATPQGLNYGSPGQGTAPHLAMELFKLETGLNATHIPYKGAGPLITAVLSGQVDLSFSSLSTALPRITDGQLHAIGIATAERSSRIPNVPTIQELGLPNFKASAGFGLLAPAHTPPAIISKLNKAFVDALRDPDVIQAFDAQGIDAVGSTPQEFANYINTEIKKWGGVIKRANIHSD
jgi:tripartite-type tricarboxylate transporter receptor subunit TctC